MLSYKQFVLKHGAKFNGISDITRRKRYQDYVSSFRPAARTKLITTGANFKNYQIPVMSPCAMHYGKALTNPFDGFQELPCIPDPISIPSYKYMAITRGTLTIGTNGIGFVAAKPFVPANDQACVEFTLLGYAGAGYQPFPFLNTGVGLSNSPMTTANFNPISNPNEWRLVGCGLQVKYQSSEFARSGVVILHRQPGNGAIPVGSIGTQLLQNTTSVQAIATRRPESVNYRPDTPVQLGYQVAIPNVSSMMIYIEGGTPGTVWNFEMRQFFETIGNFQNPTVAHSDPVGMGAVLGSLPVANSEKTPAQQEKVMQKAASKNIAKATSQVVSFIGAAGKTLAGAFTGNPANLFQGISDGMNVKMGSISDAAMITQGSGVPLIEEAD